MNIKTILQKFILTIKSEIKRMSEFTPNSSGYAQANNYIHQPSINNLQNDREYQQTMQEYQKERTENYLKSELAKTDRLLFESRAQLKDSEKILSDSRGLLADSMERMKTIDLKMRDIKPVEIKPLEFKPIEFKPIEIKSFDFKPIEIKPFDFKPIEFKPFKLD